MPTDTGAPNELAEAPRRWTPYMVCLDLAGRQCVVVGGGAVAERKIGPLLASGARVRLVSPKVTTRLDALAAARQIEWVARGYEAGDLDGAVLVFAVTDDPAVNRRVAADAAARGALTNIADGSERGGFTVPAVLRRGDLSVAISTGGGAPAYARRLRERLERDLGPEYGQALALYASARAAILAAPAERQGALWDDLFALELEGVIQTQGLDAAGACLAAWLTRHGFSSGR